MFLGFGTLLYLWIFRYIILLSLRHFFAVWSLDSVLRHTVQTPVAVMVIYYFHRHPRS